MFELIKKALIGGGSEKAERDEGSAERETMVAACAILLEAAHIDFQCTGDELDHLLETMRQRFNLPEDYARELMELAHAERKQAVDLWHHASRINETHTRKEKMEIMELIWQVILADGRLDKHEAHFAGKISGLLRLSHAEMIDAKLKAMGK